MGKMGSGDGTLSCAPEEPRPSRRVLSGVPDMPARYATHRPLPQLLSPQAPVNEVLPFTLLVLRG